MSFRRTSSMVVGALLVACSQEGSQTGSEGSQDPCRPGQGTEVDEATARALGFAVDEELPLFGQAFEAPFHEGNVDPCTVPPSNDGNIRVLATLKGIVHETLEPTWSDFPEACPEAGEDQLYYRADIELQTDDGTLTATVPANAYSRKLDSGDTERASLSFSTTVPPSAVSGSLVIHIDPSRPVEETWASVEVELAATGSKGLVKFDVFYLGTAEPRAEHGDGIFWPSDAMDQNARCGWLDPYSDQHSEGMSIDEYNAR